MNIDKMNNPGKYLTSNPDMADMVISSEGSRKQMIQDYFSRIMHKPRRKWFDLYTPLEVNGVFLGNGGFIITLFTFISVNEKKCQNHRPEQVYQLTEDVISQSLSHICLNYVTEIDGLIAAVSIFPRSSEESILLVGPDLVAGVKTQCDTSVKELDEQYGIVAKCYVGNATYGI